MATLTLVAIQARKTIRYGIVLFFVIVIGRIALLAAIEAYKNLRPAPPPPPTVNFGRLATLPFPDLNIELPELNFILDTPTGTLPSLADQRPVYYMPQKTATLFSTDRMRQRATALGFTGPPFQTSETIFTFTHGNVPATLTMDVVYETFSLSFNLAADSSPLTARPPDVQTATRTVRQRLTQASSMPEDLNGEVFHEFLRIEGQNLVTALALSDAQLTKINLKRNPITIGEGESAVGYPSVTANPKEGNVWFIVSGSSERERALIAGEYRYFPVDYTRVETYPIKTSEQAFNDLKAGRGYIANLGLNTDGQITIRRVYLGYYDPNVPYTYYQPVFVFEGDGDFVAYVPAVTDEYYGDVATENN